MKQEFKNGIKMNKIKIKHGEEINKENDEIVTKKNP